MRARRARRPGGRQRRSPEATEAAAHNRATVNIVATAGGKVALPSSLSVKDLADLLRLSPIDVIKGLMKNGIMASINQAVDYETAAKVASDYGYEPERKAVQKVGVAAGQQPLPMGQEELASLRARPPVVTVMGHVDHGKTSLLDAIRKTNVIATETGGITQHIGAYQVDWNGQRITFLDTPGHEAFTAMRARGAQATDIAVLVVAADDGVMPQTKEAVDHARAAGVPIIVAINKIDKPNANPERVKQELSDNGLLIEEWGGDVICVPVSAKMKQGLGDLLENILVVAEVAELKANPGRPASGVVIEARLDKTKGPLATVLVQNGTLHVGDNFIAGATYGKVKAMLNERGRRLRRAEPATPVEILGLDSVPQAGDSFAVLPDEKTARQMALEAGTRGAGTAQAQRALSLDNLLARVQTGDVKELNLILKTDVQGSIEPIRNSLEKLSDENLKVHVIHSGTGSVTESDVMLAMASKGIIVGFNARVEPGARRLAEQERVDLRLYGVIYELVDDVKKALTGMLEPRFAEVLEGRAEVRQVFKIGRRDAVAGSYVTEGKLVRGALAKVSRGGELLVTTKVSSLRRFKDDVREALSGFECGVGLEGFSDFQEGDVIETYSKERIQ